MTRGRVPPDSLSAEDIMSLAQVRKDIWINGAKGFFFGGSSAYILHRAAVLAKDKKYINKAPLNRNTAFASVMIGASLGSFLFATSKGKNSVHTLHPIFERGAKTPAVEHDDDDKNKSYKRSLQRAKEREDDLRELERSRLISRRQTDASERFGEEKADLLELERNRIMRRASLSRSLKEGHGLSDSHGGHWVQDDSRKG